MDDVGKEPQDLQPPWEQPQLGLPDVWDNMSNKGPLLKRCEEGDDTDEGSLEDPEQLRQLQPLRVLKE